jgi:hypothetical protein
LNFFVSALYVYTTDNSGFFIEFYFIVLQKLSLGGDDVMIEKHRDSTKEWNKENKALKRMTTPTPYKKEQDKSSARKT